MNIDYSFLLFILVLISGLICLFDALVTARQRRQEAEQYIAEKQFSADEIREFYRQHGKQKENTGLSEKRRQQLEQLLVLEKEPAVVEYSKSFFPILFLVFFFRSFLFEPFQIPTGSMIPSLNVGDYIVVNKYAYGVRLPVIGTRVIPVGEPQRGDVMVFIPPHDPNYFVKRVVGLPGDHVRYEDKVLYINGEEMPQEILAVLDDSMIHATERLGEIEHEIHMAPHRDRYRPDFWLQPGGRVIPDGHYFMMGDNRDNSDDSRRWGVVSEDNIVGKAVAVWMHKEPGLSWPSFSHNRLIRP